MRVATGLLTFSSRQFAHTIKLGPFLCPLHTSSLLPEASVAGGVCRPRSEAPCIYICGSCVRVCASSYQAHNLDEFNPTLLLAFDCTHRVTNQQQRYVTTATVRQERWSGSEPHAVRMM